jgi:hypothetical protein
MVSITSSGIWWVNPTRRKEKNMEWIKVQEVRPNGCPCGYIEYISEDGTMGRQVWFDGYEEIYEIEK